MAHSSGWSSKPDWSELSGALMWASRYTRPAGWSLRTAQHVIDQRTIDVGATHTNGVEQCFVVRDKVPSVRQLVVVHLVVTGLAQHHEPA